MDDGFSFDLSAASWRRSLSDQRAFVKALAVRLEQALPGLAEVQYRRRLFSQETTVERITVQFDDSSYILETDRNQSVTTQRAKVVRGIRLKTDALPFEEWLLALSEELRCYAEQHAAARDAMERFLFS